MDRRGLDEGRGSLLSYLLLDVCMGVKMFLCTHVQVDAEHPWTMYDPNGVKMLD